MNFRETIQAVGDLSTTVQTPEWIVSSIGELGVKIGERCFFYRDGNAIEYHTPPEGRTYRKVRPKDFAVRIISKRCRNDPDLFEMSCNIPIPEITREKKETEPATATVHVFENPEDVDTSQLEKDLAGDTLNACTSESGFLITNDDPALNRLEHNGPQEDIKFDYRR